MMTEQEQTYLDLLEEWQQEKRAAASHRDREMELRTMIFKASFLQPKEGVNKIELADGRVIKGEFKINRTVDEAALGSIIERLPEHVSVAVFKYKASLSMAEFKKQSKEMQDIISECIVAREGSPTLEII